ncbi:hypothetical protein SAMN05444487_10326 [Marininema mesophilum]|uniref:Uncharacterized protein n=1 Tax=Marininema mesophilum TaxID=1048340 RepID=A0A1H2T4L8_9BACL|nr:hypothetical protein [Marininema mesophilum]SDW38808.1 hypothetical protein SAMN05444487_10326 [Marininema mesophilum]
MRNSDKQQVFKVTIKDRWVIDAYDQGDYEKVMQEVFRRYQEKKKNLKALNEIMENS